MFKRFLRAFLSKMSGRMGVTAVTLAVLGTTAVESRADALTITATPPAGLEAGALVTAIGTAAGPYIAGAIGFSIPLILIGAFWRKLANRAKKAQ